MDSVSSSRPPAEHEYLMCGCDDVTGVLKRRLLSALMPFSCLSGSDYRADRTRFRGWVCLLHSTHSHTHGNHYNCEEGDRLLCGFVASLKVVSLNQSCLDLQTSKVMVLGAEWLFFPLFFIVSLKVKD